MGGRNAARNARRNHAPPPAPPPRPTGAQRAEVLRRLGHDVRAQAHFDAPDGLAVGRDVEKDLGVGRGWHRGGVGVWAGCAAAAVGLERGRRSFAALLSTHHPPVLSHRTRRPRTSRARAARPHAAAPRPGRLAPARARAPWPGRPRPPRARARVRRRARQRRWPEGGGREGMRPSARMPAPRRPLPPRRPPRTERRAAIVQMGRGGGWEKGG